MAQEVQLTQSNNPAATSVQSRWPERAGPPVREAKRDEIADIYDRTGNQRSPVDAGRNLNNVAAHGGAFCVAGVFIPQHAIRGFDRGARNFQHHVWSDDSGIDSGRHNGEKSLLFVTDRKRVVYVPTRDGYSVMMSVPQPEQFVATLQSTHRID
jgi:hypothetical protein